VIDPIDVNANAQEKVNYFISNLILISIQMNSSDIHLMPGKKVMSVKERVDGVLREICTIPAATAVAVISRFKAMVDCSIEEKQLPQDGRFSAKHNDDTFDFSASFIPTIYGESMTARRTLQGLPLMKLEDVQIQDDDMQRLRRWMKSPYGTVLFTGPTGSGKVTVLYAALREITSPSINTIAIEDPVLYELENVTHVSVNMRVGFTIPVALRAIMRHDPDVIVVSEIRDRDTALLTSQCALTGHLMISVLGVGSCLQGIKMLNDFGMERHLISESMTGIINQRLVRRICGNCRVKTTVSQDKIDEMRKMAGEGGYKMPEKVEFSRGEGCSECHGSGYRGRTGVYALLEFTRKIREAFNAGMPDEAIQKIAIREGMHTMAADGIR
ncbi:MAG: GspE/PulE family protein, partial [bacterium]